MSIFKKLFKKKNTESKIQEELKTFSVKQVIRETDKAVTLVFDKPDSGFDFISGQYLTLEKEIDGKTVRRAYSLCSQPNESELKITVKETPNGFFSKYVNQKVDKGTTFKILPPAGNFTFEPNETKNRHVVAFAGGSGITPIISIAINLLENEPNSKFTLIYGNRIETDIIFKNELNKATENHVNRFNLIHVLSDVTENPLGEFTGFITEDVIKKLNSDYCNFSDVDSFYLCGPGEMIQSVEHALSNLGIDNKRIKKELFSAPISSSKEKTGNKNEIIIPAKLELIYNGKSHTFDYTDDSKTILDMALDNGVKAPFSCLNGVCCTCSAKLVSGTVMMDQNFALEPEDVTAGYILTCQSKPTSQSLSVNWDDNKM